MNDGLGGMFSSRINLNLREDKHWSYGAHSVLLEARGDRLLAVVAPVQADKTKESMEEIHKEFRDILGERPLTAEELKDIQSHETLSLPGSKETMGGGGQCDHRRSCSSACPTITTRPMRARSAR